MAAPPGSRGKPRRNCPASRGSRAARPPRPVWAPLSLPQSGQEPHPAAAHRRGTASLRCWRRLRKASRRARRLDQGRSGDSEVARAVLGWSRPWSASWHPARTVPGGAAVTVDVSAGKAGGEKCRSSGGPAAAAASKEELVGELPGAAVSLTGLLSAPVFVGEKRLPPGLGCRGQKEIATSSESASERMCHSF